MSKRGYGTKERAKAIDMLELIISMIICRFAGLVGSVSRCPCVTEDGEAEYPSEKAIPYEA